MAREKPFLTNDADGAKRWLRRYLILQRQSIPTATRQKLSRIIVKKLIASPLYKKSRVIASFLGFASEVDTQLLIQHAWKQGKKVLIPIASHDFNKPYFALFRKGERLVQTRFGPSELMVQKKPFPFRSIDLVIVPGLGFDDRGYRLGYGGGVYDRMLVKARRAKRVGLFFSQQRLRRVPLESHDQRLDAVVTDLD